MEGNKSRITSDTQKIVYKIANESKCEKRKLAFVKKIREHFNKTEKQ